MRKRRETWGRGEGERSEGERAEKKKGGERRERGTTRGTEGVGHAARVFRSIPPFRLALRSVPVDTPRTPYFLPFGFARY